VMRRASDVGRDAVCPEAGIESGRERSSSGRSDAKEPRAVLAIARYVSLEQIGKLVSRFRTSRCAILRATRSTPPTRPARGRSDLRLGLGRAMPEVDVPRAHRHRSVSRGHSRARRRPDRRNHRFFLRHFFASCKRVPRSGGPGEEPGESDLAEVDCAGHQPASAERDAPAARARDFSDEMVGV